MDKEELNDYLRAGEINRKAQEKARKMISPGIKLLELAEEIEEFIKSQGKETKLAFPINLSINEIAAHFTPSKDCTQILEKNDLIKVDIGVAVNGFIADTSFSVSFNKENEKIIQASENALEAAVKKFSAGTELREIGKTIQKEINLLGFTPIQNLSGHGLGKGLIHASPTIPNIDNKDPKKIDDNAAYAIEPFASNGEGYVREGIQTEILQLNESRQVRGAQARKLLEFIEENFEFFPFAVRHLQELKMNEFDLRVGLKELRQKEVLKAYPILKETEGKIVSQAETSVILFEGKAYRLV